ncbi:MAG: hypothetical protein AAGA92_02890 [Planctomycetota bacterium]
MNLAVREFLGGVGRCSPCYGSSLLWAGFVWVILMLPSPEGGVMVFGGVMGMTYGLVGSF